MAHYDCSQCDGNHMSGHDDGCPRSHLVATDEAGAKLCATTPGLYGVLGQGKATRPPNDCWVSTWRGHRFELAAPTPVMVDIRDIAHNLSQICRYTGGTPTMYSVAQHSVLASLHVVRGGGAAYDDDLVMLRRWALLHDADEAYTNDLSRPMKALLNKLAPGVWESIVAPIRAAVMTKFGLPLAEPAAVKVIDRRLCVTEKRDIKKEPLKPEDLGLVPLHATISAWPSSVAERAFMQRFEELWQ